MGIVRLIAATFSAILVGSALHLAVLDTSGAHILEPASDAAAHWAAALVRLYGFYAWAGAWLVSEWAWRTRRAPAAGTASRHLSFGPVAVYAVFLLVAAPLDARAIERTRAGIEQYIRDGSPTEVEDTFEIYFPTAHNWAYNNPAAPLYYGAVLEGLESGDPAARSRALLAFFRLRDAELHWWDDDNRVLTSVERAVYDTDPTVRALVRGLYEQRGWTLPK